MHCKHCGKKLKYDIDNDTYAIYNGDIYCSTDCIRSYSCYRNHKDL